ncbi:MAG: hypothetical protein QM802_19995 [Agriterribacter sp.]
MDLNDDSIIAVIDFKPDDRKRRIKAKYELWEYLESAKLDIIQWKGSQEEIIEDISHKVLRFMGKVYSFLEMYNEVVAILAAFRIQVPEDLLTQHLTQTLELIIHKQQHTPTLEDKLRDWLDM